MIKLRSPAFWNYAPNLTIKLLTPFTYFTKMYGNYRSRKTSCRVSVPVLCCGNISVGGTGKTPLTLSLARLLQKKGFNPHIITKGYGGNSKQQRRVSVSDDPSSVGDESILLARQAPTWRGKNRLLSAQSAIACGADCLILDDGLQDPSLYKNFSILIIDGPVGLGNGHLLPAGPLRETLQTALNRLQAAVIIGNDTHKISNYFPKKFPFFKAELSPGDEIRTLSGKQCIAFCGIGRPEKFFLMLHELDINVIRSISFPDHHTYSNKDIEHLTYLMQAPGTTLITTEKDAVKLPQYFIKKITVLSIDLLWQNPEDPDCLLGNFLK